MDHTCGKQGSGAEPRAGAWGNGAAGFCPEVERSRSPENLDCSTASDHKKHLDAVAAQVVLAMASTKKSNLPPKINSRFTEKDLNDVFTFEFEKPRFGLLGKAKKKLATCKVE
ncbi:unnamed protein product [Caretta caretta]